MATPIPVFLKKAKNGILARQTLRATDLKLGMHTQLHSGSNMGWVSPGHTSFSGSVRLKTVAHMYACLYESTLS